MSVALTGQLFVIAAFCTSVSITFQDFDVLKFDLQQFSDVPIRGEMKMFRGAQRVYKFNATATITSDDLSIYDVEANVYRSAIGNNQFILSPYALPRKSLCDFLNTESEQWDKVIDDLANYSNIPREHGPNIDYCKLLIKDKRYEIVNYSGNVSNVSKYVPTGTFKFIGSIIDRNTNAVVLKVLTITKLY